MMAGLTINRLLPLLSALWLLPAAAQNAPAANAADAPVAVPAARPSPNAAATAKPGAPAATAAGAPAPATPASAPKAAAPATAAPASAAPAPATPAATPPKAAKKGQAPEPAEPPPKPGPLKPPGCAVAEFRAICIDTQDTQARREKASTWLKKKARDCTPEQLIVMRNNRAQWLGAADSAQMAAAIDGLLESFAETRPEVAVLLYGTPPELRKPKDDKGKADAKK